MNKAMLAIMVVAVVGGGVVGLAMMGTIDIPGLSPAKKKAGAAAAYSEDKEGKLAGAADQYSGDKGGKGVAKVTETDAKKKKPPVAATKPKVVKPAFVVDPEAGRKKVAKLWNELSVDAMLKMVDSYKGPDLPKILAIMDSSKVSQLLEKLDPAKAAKLSKEIQQEASKVKAST